MKISLFLMVFIITTFLFSASATDYTIDNDLIYIDDSNIYLSACPHTLRESGYVYFNLTSKQYTGDIDFFFGFDSLQCKPISAEIFIDGNWIDISHRFNSINYNYDGLNKWYYLKEIPIFLNTDYTLRAYLKINEISTGGKYGVAIKPSSETISQAVNNNHFYYLDPWWDGSYLYRKTITLTGNTSGAQTDYQLLLNVTYDSDMQADFDDLRFTNDTQQIDVWLKSKVDSSYALIWVKFPTTPADSIEQDYYMYYGNNSVGSDWNGTTTFIQYHGTASATFLDTLNIDPTNTTFEAKARTTSDTHNFRIGLSNTEGAETDDCLIIVSYDTTNNRYLSSRKNFAATVVSEPPKFVTNTYYELKIINNGSTVSGFVNDNQIAGNITTNIATDNMGLSMWLSAGTGDQLWSFVRKYVSGPPTYIFGSEKKQMYIPPTPINLQNTTNNFWINHTWQPGIGNTTDFYNVSVNNIWHNETTNTYWNTTYAYGNDSWQNITIWAYNNTGVGSLSPDSISQNTQLYFTNLPTNLQRTHDHTWVNWTWNESFIGTHIIDSYNVSINSTWHNSTTNQSYNHTGLDYELTSSIIVYGYNTTQGLSIYYISGSYTFPIKNKMVKAIEQLVTPIQIIADKFFNIIPFIISIILFAGFGLAIMVMTSRFKKW